MSICSDLRVLELGYDVFAKKNIGLKEAGRIIAEDMYNKQKNEEAGLLLFDGNTVFQYENVMVGNEALIRFSTQHNGLVVFTSQTKGASFSSELCIYSLESLIMSTSEPFEFDYRSEITLMNKDTAKKGLPHYPLTIEIYKKRRINDISLDGKFSLYPDVDCSTVYHLPYLAPKDRPEAIMKRISKEGGAEYEIFDTADGVVSYRFAQIPIIVTFEEVGYKVSAYFDALPQSLELGYLLDDDLLEEHIESSESLPEGVSVKNFKTVIEKKFSDIQIVDAFGFILRVADY